MLNFSVYHVIHFSNCFYLFLRCDNHWLPPSILNTEEISFEHVNEIINKNSKERALKDEIYDGEDKV